ncbi:hypothetical protein HDU86_004525 [Geranomyces michiganensis]|nr:hypothetical protein HDU86_004525 [Geranomyces michiganensis]
MPSQPPQPQYIEPADLVALLSDPAQKPGSSYLIVDVRDDDFAHGNIKGACNIPAHELCQESDAALLERFRGVKKLVFHCALSQVRGPKCARRFADAQSKAGVEHPAEVYILRGGFENWQTSAERRAFVEAYNAKYWENPY